MRTLKYAWRFLMRSKSYTIINLLGLAFSLACSIILIRYIHRELTVDAHSVDPEHIIIPLRDMEGNIHPGSLQQDWTEADSVYILDHQIVEQCRLMLQQRDNVVYENSNYAMNIAAVDSTFFHFFHYPIVAGEASLEAPNDAIITQHYARNIFGKENPIGKVLEYYGKNITIKGVIGELEEPETELDFLKRIKKTFEVGCLRHTRLSGRLIQKVALCGGAGAFLLPKAVSADADVFITGEVKYHDYFNYENNILVAEVGHYESEQYTKEYFIQSCRRCFRNWKSR